MLQFIAIIVLTVFGAIIYGIFHDQITARICVEYFTIGHPPIFATSDPTLLGFGWGILATWWVGLILGTMLALACRIGTWPQLSVAKLYRPLAIALMIIGCIAAVGGIAGHIAAEKHWTSLVGPIAERIPADKQIGFLTDLWIHLTSYAAGGVVGAGLCIWALIYRKNASNRIAI